MRGKQGARWADGPVLNWNGSAKRPVLARESASAIVSKRRVIVCILLATTLSIIMADENRKITKEAFNWLLRCLPMSRCFLNLVIQGLLLAIEAVYLNWWGSVWNLDRGIR